MVRDLALLLASLPLHAQAPKVGDVNVYGLRKVPQEKVLAALAVRPGDPLPPSKGKLEDRLEELPNVVLSRVQAMCCEDGKAILFVGIEEKGAPHFAYRSEPSGVFILPQSIIDAYRRLMEAVEAAGRRGSTAEDLTEGHALMADPAARAVQREFLAYAVDHVSELRDVLRASSDPEQRAIAALVIGYAPRKRDVIDDLQYAVQDPDEAVRANAMRSLAAISVLAARKPELGLKIEPTWFIEMLNSIVLSDRVKACEALLTLTDRNGDSTLQLLRERSLPALIEMARWKTLRYAVAPFVLVGRIAGLSEDEIHARWEKGDREAVIDVATRKAKSRG